MANSAIVPCSVLFVSLLLNLLAPYCLGSSYRTNATYTMADCISLSVRGVRRRRPHLRPVRPPYLEAAAGSNRLPVVHRLSSCSPLGAARSHGKPSADADVDGDDVFRRDAMRLHSLFREEPTTNKYSPAPPSSPSSSDALTIPTTGSPLGSLPGTFEYHVAVGFGTPVQVLTVGFDTATQGATLLQCKPCAAAGDGAVAAPCNDVAFDPSASSTVSQVPCGSPDCPLSSCSGEGCTVAVTKDGAVLANATFVMDTFAFSPSAFALDFRFACLEMGLTTVDHSSGILDLSRDRHSLASRAPTSPDTVAFTYCLPPSNNAMGFLSIAAARPELSGRDVRYATLGSSAAHPTRYVVKLAGIGLAGPDITIPPAALAGCDSLLDLHTTFTYLRRDIYAALRDGFRGRMRGYRAAPPVGELDTCYDFTGHESYVVPSVTLRLDGGVNLDLDLDQMMYFPDQWSFFSVGCLAFAAAPRGAAVVAVIGTLVKKSTEVVYDVSGGKVGFIPSSC